MADLFLSYAREATLRAGKLADSLAALGWTIWWDRRLLAGKDFNKHIQSELDAARCIVVLWSKASVESSFVRDEATEGKDDGRLAPVLIESVKQPIGFRQLHAVDLSNWNGSTSHDQFEMLARSIADIVPSSHSSTAVVSGRAGHASLLAVHPLAYLIHDRKDLHAFMAITARLKAHGVSVYRHEQRSGTEPASSEIIRHAEGIIDNKADYAIAVWSPVMDDNAIRIWNAEIYAARQKQLRYGPSHRFIFPVAFEPGRVPDALLDLPVQDVSTPEGLESLARDIITDWKARSS